MAKKSNKKRADGRIAVQVYIGKVDNKRKYKTVYGATQKEADAKAEELKILINKGIDIRQQKSFSFWADNWIKSIKTTKTETQAHAHAVNLEYVNRFIGSCDISKIRTYQIQEIINILAERNENTGKPTAKKTLKNYITSINFVFEFAITNRIIDFNPCRNIQIPDFAPQEERRAISKQEQEWILNTPHICQIRAMLAMLAGLRRGEITALMWNDIDFKNKTIAINKSYDFKLNKLKPPKTKAGYRTVPIPDNLFQFLLQQKKISLYVCPNRKGKMLSTSSWQKNWDSYLMTLNKKYGDFTDHNKKMERLKKEYKEKGIPLTKLPKSLPMVIEPFSIHCLRHTYATILYDAGVDVLTARKLLGHSDIKTTLGIYTHLSEENEKLNVDKLNSFLSETKSEQA